MPEAPHALLWVRDSAWHSYLCCCTSCPTRKPLHHYLPSLTFPSQREAGGFSHVRLCTKVWEPPSVRMNCMQTCISLTGCELSGLAPVKAERGCRGAALFRVTLAVSGVAKAPTPSHPPAHSQGMRCIFLLNELKHSWDINS